MVQIRAHALIKIQIVKIILKLFIVEWVNSKCIEKVDTLYTTCKSSYPLKICEKVTG